MDGYRNLQLTAARTNDLLTYGMGSNGYQRSKNDKGALKESGQALQRGLCRPDAP